jgi:hypothetical protein
MWRWGIRYSTVAELGCRRGYTIRRLIPIRLKILVTTENL